MQLPFRSHCAASCAAKPVDGRQEASDADSSPHFEPVAVSTVQSKGLAASTSFQQIQRPSSAPARKGAKEGQKLAQVGQANSVPGIQTHDALAKV